MRLVHETAERVIIWLGASNYGIDCLFNWMVALDQQMLAKPHPHTISTWEYTARCMTENHKQTAPDKIRGALNSLLQRNWFSRIWVLQEAAVAKSALIACGWKEVNSRTFAVMPTLLNIDCGAGVQARFDILPGLLRAQSRWLESSLLTLLQNFGRSKATDPRDIVYALLGLSRDTTSSDLLRPDYQLSVEEVTQGTVTHLMLQAHDLPEQTPIQSLPKWDMNEFLYSLHNLPLHVFQWATAHAQDALLHDLIMSQRKKDNVQRVQQYMSCAGHHGPPITVAMKRKNSALAAMLLRLPGVGITTRDSDGQSPLSVAVAQGNKVIAHCIRQHRQIDLLETDPDHAALLVAATRGRPGLARLSLRNRRLGTSVVNFRGDTLLLAAAKQGDLAVMESILRHSEVATRMHPPREIEYRPKWPVLGNPRWEGIFGTYEDVSSISSRYEKQPWEHLRYGKQRESSEMQRTRPERRRARAKGLGKLTPFESALVRGLFRVINEEASVLRGAVRKAVTHNRFANLRNFVDLEACLADAGWFGFQTPLGAAAQAGDKGSVSVLLDNGADINARDCDERAATPLWNAASRGHTDTARLLVERGADIELMANEDPIETTPLVWVAASYGHDDIVNFLIEHGANVRKALTMAFKPSRKRRKRISRKR